MLIKGVSGIAVKPDIMHTKHIGVDTYFYGSVMMWMITRVMPGSKDANFAKLWERILHYYKVLHIKVRYNEMKLSMIQGDIFPHLKGKASEIKHLIQPLLATFLEYHIDGDRVHALVKAGLEASLMIETILRESAGPTVFKLEEADWKDFSDSVLKYVAANAALSNVFHPMGVPLFHYTIKAHYLLHIGLMSKHLHPSLCSCYSGEDFMHKSKLIVAACCAGTKHHDVFPKTLEKFAVHMGFRFAKAIRWR